MAEPAIARVVELRAVEAVPHEVPAPEAMVAHQAMMADEAVSWSSAFSPGYNGNVEFLVRWEYHAHNFLGFVQLACLIVLLRQF